jgi:cytochrome c oxidase subunit 4
MSEHAADPHVADPIEHRLAHAVSPELIAREKRRYLMVFAALAVLTVITVLISRVDVNRPLAIGIALAIATLKATLVAGYFMHLLHERKFIYGVLVLTLFLFGMLLWGPWHQHAEAVGDFGVHGATDITSTTTAAAQQPEH